MTKRDSLGRIRRPTQDKAMGVRSRPDCISISHNINMTPDAHQRLARLTPQERGDLIMRALAGASESFT